MYNTTCVQYIEEHSNVMETNADQWEMIIDILTNLKEIKIKSIETIMVALKDYDKLLPEKSDLSKLRDILKGISDII